MEKEPTNQELYEEQSVFSEFLTFLMENKAWWITPAVLILILVIGFIVMTAMSDDGVAPFVYTLF